jgi:hypothetical protein
MNKKYFFTAMLVGLLVFGLVFVSCGGGSSALIGSWVSESAGDDTSFELLKDGTAIWRGYSATWKTEKNRLIVTAMGQAISYDYELSGSTLTLTYDGETGTYKKQ